MNFFKSVFSEQQKQQQQQQQQEDEHPSSDSDKSPATSPESRNKNPNAATWSSLNTLINTLSTKTESYRRDLQDFTSGIKAETSLITSVASRAARDLPSSLDATASAAQYSLESLGYAIDSIGSAVSDIIISSHQTSVSLWGEENNSDDDNRDLSLDRPYSRLESLIRAIQCDINTYCKEIDDLSEYEEWKVGFDLNKKTEEIDGLIGENGEIGEIYDEVVPQLVDEETFWTRYFFRVHKVTKAEEARAKLVKRVIRVEEEEELSWDVDEEDVNGDLEKESTIGVEEGEKMLGSSKESDISIVSSQPSMVVEGIGWDEIEESGKADKVKKVSSDSPNVEELRKRLSAMGKDDEDEEELGWDIEDDDEPLKT